MSMRCVGIFSFTDFPTTAPVTREVKCKYTYYVYSNVKQNTKRFVFIQRDSHLNFYSTETLQKANILARSLLRSDEDSVLSQIKSLEDSVYFISYIHKKQFWIKS